MSTYKEIKGFKVQTLASDTAASQASTGTWASGGAINTGRSRAGGFGTQTASMLAGGLAQPGSSQTDNSEVYNGTAWTEVNNLNTARGRMGGTGAGTTTSGMVFGGGNPPGVLGNTETWDGTSWTEVNDLNTARQHHMGCGTVPAGLCVGGNNTTSPTPVIADSEEFNGTSWTEGNNLNAARRYGGSAGATNAAAIVFGGNPYTTATESYNGTSYTEVNEMNTGRESLGSNGTQTSGLAYGGEAPSIVGNTESFDGTNWTEVNDLATATYEGTGTGASNASGLYSSGESPSAAYTLTQEWTATPAADFTKQNLGQVYYNSGSNAFKVTKTVYGTGSWASGGAMNTARAQVAGAGSQGAGIVVGGTGPPPGSQNAELYNGSAWTETGNLSGIARRLQAGTGGGSQNSAISIGGYSAPPSPNGTLDLVESWDGSSWSEIAEISTARYQAMGAGSSYQSAMTAGGETAASGETANTEVWDNSSWTESGNLPGTRTQCAGGGPVTSALIAGQTGSPKGIVSTWNGASWSDVTELNTDRQAVMAMISNDTAGTVAGGTSPGAPNTVNTEQWNGTAWTEVANLASGRYNGTGVGIFSEGFVAGGGTSASGTTTTEEWTVPATATNTTITVS